MLNFVVHIIYWDLILDSQLSLLDQTRTRAGAVRVEKREFPWEFSQLSLLDKTRTRVAWELTSEGLHESFLNFHFLIKREQELHESWQVRVDMRVFSTFIAWSNENKSCMRVEKREFTDMRVFSTFIAWSNENKSYTYMRIYKREFTWEFFQLLLLDQTRTRRLHESWQARVYMGVFSTFTAWSNEKNRAWIQSHEFDSCIHNLQKMRISFISCKNKAQ
jgi:hypothetical protein